MVKPKAQTLQQRLGFFDEDLKSPKHDELMLWLDNNIETIVNEKFNKEYTAENIKVIIERESKKIQNIIDNYNSSIQYFEKQLTLTDRERNELPQSLRYTNDELNEILEKNNRKKQILQQFNISVSIPSKPRITRIQKKWELPVTTNNYQNKYTIGFIDFVASFNVPVLELGGLISKRKDQSFELDYYDFNENELQFHYTAMEKTILVEVKSEIKSLGELIRQINHYKTYVSGDYYVMCPDNQYKKTLKDQGIDFIDYK